MIDDTSRPESGPHANNSNLAWALHYIARGFSVVSLYYPKVTGSPEVARCSCGAFPCDTNNRRVGKHPIAFGWTTAPDMTAEQATAWWSKPANVNANVGLRMGRKRRLVAIDVDGAEGRASLAKLEAELGPLPETMTTKSGRIDGGEHRIFTLPEAVDIDTIANLKIAPGIDVKCEGGQVVAPPCLHASGNRYVALDPRDPVELPLAWCDRLPRKAPDAVAAPCAAWPTPTVEGLAAARKWLATALPSIQGKNGSGALMKACGVLVRGLALGPELGGEIVREYNDTKAEPKWSETEIAHAIDNAAKSTKEPAVGSMLPDVDLYRAITEGAASAAPSPPSVVSAVSFVVIGATQLAELLPPVDYLVHGLGIVAGPPTLIAGYGFSGKTASAQQMAVNLARPDHAGDWMNPRPVWGHFRGGRRAKVLHLDFEQGRRLTQRRYQRLAHAGGVDLRELEGFLMLLVQPQLYLNTKTGLAALERLCEGLDLAIIDSFLASCPGLEENSSNAREPLDALTRISERTGCAFEVICHARKPNGERAGGVKMAVRGSSAIFDACNSVLIFDGDEKGQPKRIYHEKERNSGITVDDFDLVIEDVGEAKEGLRVRGVDVAKKTTDEKEQEKIEVQVAADAARLRTWVAKKGYFSSRDQAAAALHISSARVGKAIGALLNTEPQPELINDGNKTRPYYRYVGEGMNGAATMPQGENR